MNEIISSFSPIIQDWHVVQERRDSKISELKIRFVFIDQSILEYTEIKVHDLNKRKYAFQWMAANHDLLIRWDNALHHPHIATFPHHKHTGNEKTITESSDITLLEVLTEIRQLLSNS